MTLYFAYGSNMSRPLMQTRCPTAREVGIGVLEGHRFMIAAEGYASVAPFAGGRVHGVLWRLTARDLAALNIYESVESGLYYTRRRVIRHGPVRRNALVYIAGARAVGTPRPGYLELVVAAARAWDLPQSYVRELMRWTSSGFHGARALSTGEIR
jgi:cation transport regulator ChaC